MTAAPVEFRNVVRYVRDVEANVPLYHAIGFTKVVRRMEDMVVLQNDLGLKLVLHRWDERPTSWLDTALGLTMTGTVDEARAFVEKAGFRLLRAPDAEDAGFFYVYGDLDGNPVNLVGHPGARSGTGSGAAPSGSPPA